MGKRMEGELRYDYCARRIMELEEVKEKLKGELVWCSSALVPHPGEEFKDIPEGDRPIVKIKVQGTYKKPLIGGKKI